MSELNDDLSREIRIRQSMLVVRAMPVLIGGNLIAVAVIAELAWSSFLSSYAIAPAVVLIVFLMPLAVNWARLRDKPRPDATSSRRIRGIEIHSLLMGLAWAAILALLIPAVDKTEQAIILLISSFVWYGAIATIGGLPKAAFAYILPAWLTAYPMLMIDGSNDRITISLVAWIALAAVIQTGRQNWAEFRSSLARELERERIMRENLEAEAARQAEVAEAQRRMINAIPFPLVITREGGAMPVGQQAAQLFKVEADELPNHSVGEFFVHPEDEKRLFDLYSNEGGFDEFELEMQDTEGKRFWVMASARPLEYEGEACFLNSIILIDDRKRAEEALIQKEAQLRVALENMPGGMFMVDNEFEIQVSNKQIAELYQLPDHVFRVGASLRDGIRIRAQRGDYGPGDTAELVEQRSASYSETETLVAEERLPDGRIIELVRRPTEEGGTVGIATDITERKQAGERLAEQTSLLENVLANVTQGIVAFDENAHLIAWNENFEEVFPYYEGMLERGRPMLDLARRSAQEELYGEGDADQLAKARIDQLMSGDRYRGETVVKDRAGVERTYDSISQPAPGGGFVMSYTDITEHKQADAALRESESRLNSVLESIDYGILFLDSNHRIRIANRAYRELWKMPEEFFADCPTLREDLEYARDQGLIAESDEEWERYVEERLESIDKGDIPPQERSLGDGRVVIYQCTALTEGGRMLTYFDITDRKRAEEALAQKEAQLRAALDNMPSGMSLYDPDLKVVLANDKVHQFFDYPAELAEPGRSVTHIFRYLAERGDYGPGEVEELVERRIEAYASREERVSQARTPAGQIIDIRLSPVADGGTVAVFDDVTEKRKAEEELARKEAQLRLALDHMPGGMALYDRDLNYVLFNAQYSELHDYPDGLLKVGGSVYDEVRYQADRGDFGPGDKDELIEHVVATTQKGESVSYERELAGSGRTLHFEVATTPEGGHVNNVIDITARKRAEDALLEAKRRSEEASKLVAEKNHMLESLSNQLSKYLSPQVYASIFSGDQSVEIASKRKKLTIFFSDIADFTETTDSLESEELTNLLNHYLTEMSKIALDYGATIDKYVGDSVIAFFGDPETRGVKEDARTCVNMAIATQRRMRELQSEWLNMGLERPFQLRIGINTGFCTVGNFGSADRMDYTIIGNEVNLAARLESHAEVGGILLAHETHSLVKDTVLAEEGDTLTVKGFAKPVRTYSVVGLYDDLAEQGRIIRRDQDGLALAIDREKMTKKGKAEVIKAIKDVLSQLED
jgi:PAS domain S-box-containing protein